MDTAVPVAPSTVNPWLSHDAIRRLVKSLILAEQSALCAKGALPRTVMTRLSDPWMSDADFAALSVDEDDLGFDSLARLNLILRFNRFFHLAETGIEDYLLMHRRLGDWVALLDHHLSLRADKACFTFDTSGSSGPVKHISHPAAALREEMLAQRQGPLCMVPDGGRIITLVPPHHIYGFLFSCILPTILHCPVLDLHHAAPTATFRHARRGDLILGTPFSWQVMQAAGLTLPDGVYGVTSAGPATPQTWEARSRIGLSQLTEVYGATETGGIGTRTGPDMPFELLAHLRRHEDGISDTVRVPAALALQDRLNWRDERHFDLVGRLDDAVKIAGVNVSPAHVRQVICACDGVIDAQVRPDSGGLKAFVVHRADADLPALQNRLHAHILRHLAAPARPASMTFGYALPVNSIGKLCDWDAMPVPK